VLLVARNVQTLSYNVSVRCFKSLPVLQASSLYFVVHYCYKCTCYITLRLEIVTLFLYPRMPVRDTGYPFRQISQQDFKLRHDGLSPQPFQIQYSLILLLFHAA
jgi:hypothetical protein